MFKCGLIFFAVLFSFLFFNMKISRIAVLLAFKQQEEKNETIMTLIVMLLAVIFITLSIVTI